jgi:hypothetical protein
VNGYRQAAQIRCSHGLVHRRHHHGLRLVVHHRHRLLSTDNCLGYTGRGGGRKPFHGNRKREWITAQCDSCASTPYRMEMLRLEVHGGSVGRGGGEVHGRRHRRGLERRRLAREAGHGWPIEVARWRRLDVESLQHSPISARSASATPGCRCATRNGPCVHRSTLPPQERRHTGPASRPGADLTGTTYLLEVVLELLDEAHRRREQGVCPRWIPAQRVHATLYYRKTYNLPERKYLFIWAESGLINCLWRGSPQQIIMLRPIYCLKEKRLQRKANFEERARFARPLNTWCIFRGGSAQSVSFLFQIQGVRLARTFPCNNEIHQRLSC